MWNRPVTDFASGIASIAVYKKSSPPYTVKSSKTGKETKEYYAQTCE